MKKRYIVYLCVLLLIVVGGIMGQGLIPPVLPIIQLPGEVVLKWGEGSPLNGLFAKGLTNTFIAAVLTFIILLAMAFSLRAKSRTADDVPSGFYNFFEMVIEFAFGYVEGSAGKWAKAFFPFFMTFILWILVANWMELVPGVDAIGKWENLPHYAAEKAALAAKEENPDISEEELHAIELEAEHAAEGTGDLRNGILLLRAQEGDEGADWAIVPYVRAAATDLNFTIALALISVVMTQFYGMRAQGMKYWSKFFTWPAERIKQNPLAILDPLVGLLEFVSELFKIVSFAFRLLGNIFAGQVLLFVIGALLPVANLLFWHLEFAVGALQAGVFALLTLTFMAGATQGHGHGDEH
ncbi:MAG: F0F1 ATP synthase subunit A [Ardenticatenaceae bacterium]|nr:F0F1 ATP synthase subunit A [Anaerolineales bacterium]MCB8919618.1 F0F1 ATP synthase subunit A [Ardenticatenaceae bacterium]